jgi:hypothetical protein
MGCAGMDDQECGGPSGGVGKQEDGEMNGAILSTISYGLKRIYFHDAFLQVEVF